VRLVQGEMARATVYGTDPAATARAFEREGAEVIHIVDLDGAIAGAPRNLDSIRAIRSAVRCPIDVSGGLRTIDSVRDAFGAGADIVSIGSAAFLNPGLIAEACREFPHRVFGSLDARDGRLAIKGWVETSEISIGEAAARFQKSGVAAVIVTDIARDGTEAGANLAIFDEVARQAAIPVIASGGVAKLEDISALKQFFPAGVVGVITGRAIYEGRFTLAQARAIAA
jgi:phosphoribosylformimino-5-aminoimidazole carboxamide ribotide isomerase